MRTFEKSVEIQASPRKVWDIVVDFPNMPKWFRGPTKVTAPDAPRTGVGTRRVVHLAGPLAMHEVITHWEPERLFGYSVKSGVPVKSHQGLIEISQVRPGTVRVTYSTALETPIPLPGDPIGLVAGTALNQVIGDALKRLKKIAER